MAPSADSGIVGPVKPVTLTKNTFVLSLSLMHGIGCNVSGLARAPQKDWAMGQFQQCWHGSQTEGFRGPHINVGAAVGGIVFPFSKVKR